MHVGTFQSTSNKCANITVVLTLVMVDGSILFLGFLISKERTVSISNSLRPSLLVSGLKQQPPKIKGESKIEVYKCWFVRKRTFDQVTTCRSFNVTSRPPGELEDYIETFKEQFKIHLSSTAFEKRHVFYVLILHIPCLQGFWCSGPKRSQEHKQGK